MPAAKNGHEAWINSAQAANINPDDTSGKAASMLFAHYYLQL